MLYDNLVKPLLFKLDAEWIHHRTVAFGAFLGRYKASRALISTIWPTINDPVLKTDLAGLSLANPVGLGAGFDKEGRLPRALTAVGFGTMEIGSVTGEPCPGNQPPRLWRLPEDRALVVNYGLLSSGAANISRRLAADLKHGPWPMPVGISVAKSNLPHLKGEAGLNDYLLAFTTMQPLADYLTVNVSCPNVGDANQYCKDAGLYGALLAKLDTIKPIKPVFFKLSPDLSQERLLQIFEQTAPYAWAKGFILTNLTHDRAGLRSPNLAQAIKGGVSGPHLRELADATLKFAAQNARQRFVFVGCGGIDSVEDAYRKIKLGASSLQLVTSLIYHGPGWPRQLAMGLAAKLRADGFNSVREAVGAGL